MLLTALLLQLVAPPAAAENLAIVDSQWSDWRQGRATHYGTDAWQVVGHASCSQTCASWGCADSSRPAPHAGASMPVAATMATWTPTSRWGEGRERAQLAVEVGHTHSLGPTRWPQVERGRHGGLRLHVPAGHVWCVRGWWGMLAGAHVF
jgi:hypothetical protein